MEYLEGETVDEVLQRRKKLPPGEAVRLIHQALLGLQHIHERGMVHRDLKPANLMLIPAPARKSDETTAKSNIKILDIGLAREFFDENSPNMLEKAELTGEGVLLGTPDYLAPEQARDPRAIDIRADIYSLGCTLYHLLCGQPPFPDKNILNQMIRHATETPKPITDFNPGIPEGLAQIVAWMMAKQPTQRYPTPARAAQAMDAFLMVTAESTKPVEETPQMKRYLTWLEMSEPAQPEGDATIPPPDVIPPPPPAKVKSSPNVPAAAPAPAPASQKRKRRTGVRTPEAAAAPAAIPLPATPAAAPPAATAQEFDVELVEAPPPAEPLVQNRSAPPAKALPGLNLSKRDLSMLGVGAGIMLLSCLVCSGIRSLLGMLAAGE
jgi:serine/threonine protein kinase